MSADLAAAGYVPVVLPTPYAVGDVNCWLIEDDPLTLVDCGPNWATSLDALERRLAELGRRVEDLQRLVITHQHADHCGLAEIVRRRSGCEVVALDHLAPALEDYREHFAANDDFSAAMMRRHGIDDDLVTAIRAIARAFAGIGSTVEVDRRVADGETLEFAGRSWTVAHRPGHSPTDTTFHDAAARVLLAGDHVLSHISSNATIALPAGGASGDPEGPRPRPLLLYRASLAQTRATPDVDVVLGGHGDVVTDLGALLDGRDRQTDRRAEKIRALLERRGPLSAHAVARELWGQTALQQPLLTLSEALGHLDLLADRAQAVEDDAGAVSVWAAT